MLFHFAGTEINTNNPVFIYEKTSAYQATDGSANYDGQVAVLPTSSDRAPLQDDFGNDQSQIYHTFQYQVCSADQESKQSEDEGQTIYLFQTFRLVILEISLLQGLAICVFIPQTRSNRQTIRVPSLMKLHVFENVMEECSCSCRIVIGRYMMNPLGYNGLAELT